MTSSYRPFLLACAVALAACPAESASLNWDPAATGGPSGGGAGTWDTTALQWWNGTADSPWNNAGNDTAIFGGTGATVALGTGITAGGLIFNTGGYVVSGNTLTLAGTTPTIDVVNTAATATISAIVAGSAGLNKTGTGTLMLSGANTYTGGTTIAGGRVTLGNAAGLGAVSSAVAISSGATLDLAGFSAAYNIAVAGTGVGGMGALYNSSASGGSSVGTLTLTGNASIGGAVNNSTSIGINTAGINLGGNTLTLASGRLIVDNTDTFSGGGNVNVENGAVLYMTGNSAGAGAGVTITVKTGGVMDGRDYQNSALGSYPAVVLDGGMLSNGYNNSNGGGNGVNLYNPVSVTLNGGILSGNANGFSNPLRLSGALTGSGALTLQGLRGVEFQGDISGYTGTATATGGGTVWFNPTAAVQTFNGTLAGARPVQKIGNNTTVFAANNTYTGTTTVTAGTLTLSGAGTLGATTAGLAANGGVLDLAGTTQTVGALTLGGGTIRNGTINASSYTSAGGLISANLGSAIAFTQTGGNTTLSGTNALSSIVVNGGYLTIAAVGAIGSGNITSNAGGAIVATGLYGTVNGWLGSGRIAAAGTGSIAITGDSAEAIDFTGFNSMALASTGQAAYSGTITAGTGGYRFGGASSLLTVTSTLSGANALTKIDAGTVTLTAANTTGTTTVSGGTLLLAGTSSINGGAVNVTGATLAVGGSATVNATGGGAIGVGGTGGSLAAYSFNAIGAAGSTITLTTGTTSLVWGGAGAETTDRIVNHTAGSTMTNNGAGTLTFSNNITVANTGIGVTFNGGGKTVIQGFTGNTSGVLNLTKTGVGTLVVNGVIAPNTAGNIRAQSGILDFTATASTTGNAIMTSQRTVGGVARFAAGSSIRTADTNTNGIMGGWAVYNGTDWAQTNGSGNAIGGYSGYVSDTWGATNNTDITTSATVASASNTYSLRFNGAAVNSLTLAGTNVIGSGGILITANVGNNLTTITGGSLTAGATNASTDLIVHQNNTANALTVASGIVNNGTGTTSFTKAGAGTVNFSTQKTYTGATNVLEGILNLSGGGGGAGVIRGTVNVAAGATLRLSTGDATGYNTDGTRVSVINLAGGTLHVNTTSNQTLGSAVINMTGGTIAGIGGSNLDFFGGTSALNTLASGTTSVIDGINLSALRQGSTTFTTALGYTASGIDLDIRSVIQNGANGSATNAVLTKTGAGTLALSGTNTFGGTGQSITVAAGTLMIGNGGTSGNISTLAAVGVTNNAVLAFNRSDTAGIFANVISGTGIVTQIGTGASTLTGANTYAGGTKVITGRLITGNTTALGTGTVHIAGGTLQIGNGTTDTLTLAGSLTVASGTLDMGTRAGAAVTLTGAAGFLLSGGTWKVNTGIDQITLASGSFNLASGLVDLTNFANKSVAGTYSLIAGTGTSSLANGNFTGGDAGFTYRIDTVGDLVVTAVPEPSVYGLLGAGALAAAACIRRRRRVA